MQGKAPLDSHPLIFLCPILFAADVCWERWLISHSHCHGQITMSRRSRVESFKPIVRVGFYRLPGRRVIRCQKSLEGREDPRGKSEHLSRLEDEGSRAKRLE